VDDQLRKQTGGNGNKERKSIECAANTGAASRSSNDGQDHARAFCLGPTLDPSSFTDITRDAYRAAREIPVTLAQLPCYCHCDQGFGHKSLYSCFEDDHASHCDVCVREALLALKLEKEEKMSPAQIRDTIVAQYSH
jgi:hypothetical protein